MVERTGHKIKLLNRRNIYEKFCSFKPLSLPANETAEKAKQIPKGIDSRSTTGFSQLLARLNHCCCFVIIELIMNSI